jgi:hypothetical protein
MLQRFIKWIDARGEQMNPLVVRDVRRMSRNPTYPWILWVYCVAIILIVIVNWNDKREFADVSLVVAIAICCVGAFGGWMATIDMAEIFHRDELFLMNSISPHQYLHAYITISIIESLFIISLSLPLLVAAQLIGVYSFLLYMIPILAFLAGQALSSVWVSFLAHGVSPGIKFFPTVWEQIGVCFLIILSSTGIGSIILPWILVNYLRNNVFKLPTPSIYNGFDLFSIYFLLPIALLTISLTAYKLSRDGFKINYKPNYSRMIYNVLIYNVLSVCLAAIYFILILLFLR